jgi:hypothetical protein
VGSQEAEIKLPAVCRIGDLDKAWSEQVVAQPLSLALDLSGVVQTDALALLYLVAQVGFRAAHSLDTELKLPGSHITESTPAEEVAWEPQYRAVRNFMRAYNLPDAMRIATGKQFLRLLDPISRSFRGESPTTLPSEFFPLRCYRERDFGTEISRAESRMAGDPYMRAVFEHDLANPDQLERYRSTIVHEAVLNAVRHPKANLIGVVSQRDAGTGFLSLGVYDDGDPIHGTLKRAMDEGLAVFESTPSVTLAEPMEVSIQGATGKIALASGSDLSRSSDEATLWAGSFLPGVSRDIYSKRLEGHGPGMGLWIVASNTCLEFGGQVTLRSGPYFLSIKRVKRKGARSLAVKVERRPNAHFPGNLLAVRIPMSRRTQASK